MKKKYKFFYLFWIKSSRGTDDICIRAYEGRPTKDQLQDFDTERENEQKKISLDSVQSQC